MRQLAASVALVLLVGGCSQPPPGDTAAPAPPPAFNGDNPRAIPSQVPTVGKRPPTDNLPPPAEPQQAPPQTAPIPGRVVDIGKAPEGVVVDAAPASPPSPSVPNELVLIDVDTGQIVNRVPLPGFARHLQLSNAGGPVLGTHRERRRVGQGRAAGRTAVPQLVTGTVPHDAAQAQNGYVFVANEHGGTVTMLRGTQVVKVFADSVQPAGWPRSACRWA